MVVFCKHVLILYNHDSNFRTLKLAQYFIFNVTVISYMKSTSRESILYNFLQHWVDLNIFRTMKPGRTSKAALFETNLQILLSFTFFFYVPLKRKGDIRLTYPLIVFIFLQIYLDSPSHQKICLKLKFLINPNFLH